jgi:glycosyltransferase involved in cell wall biosynthesis
MKISLITVCLNSVKYIRTTIQSVLSQTYPNIEYIIVDGGSTDGTLDIINSYSNKISKFISQPDKGIYDAMNKGILMATGDIIGFLNSDDMFSQSNSIELIMNAFKESSADSVFSNLYYVKQDEPDDIVRHWQTGKFVLGSFCKGWHPAHPTFYVKRKIYSQYGLFDLEFPLAADFEIMLRFLERYKISTNYLPQVLIKMRLGGATNRNLKNIYLQNKECIKAFSKNNIKTSFFYPIYRLLPKFFQYLNN